MERKPLVPIKLDSYKPLRELVFESLREAIISGQLPPGERLMEIQLAEELGVSRTPVRGHPQVGTGRIGRRDPQERRICFRLSMRMYRMSLRSGAPWRFGGRTGGGTDHRNRVGGPGTSSCPDHKRIENGDITNVVDIDTNFHAMLYKASRNRRLGQIINNLREQIQRFRQTSLAYPGRMRAALEEHKKIVEAISARDPETARRLAQEHIENAENGLMEAIRNEKKK